MHRTENVKHQAAFISVEWPPVKELNISWQFISSSSQISSSTWRSGGSPCSTSWIWSSPALASSTCRSSCSTCQPSPGRRRPWPSPSSCRRLSTSPLSSRWPSPRCHKVPLSPYILNFHGWQIAAVRWWCRLSQNQVRSIFSTGLRNLQSEVGIILSIQGPSYSQSLFQQPWF